MSKIDNAAGVDAPGRIAPVTPPTDRRPWGVLASLGWYVLIFEVEGRAYEHLLNDTGLQAFLDRTYALHVLGVLAAWGINLLIILLAVRLTRIPVCDYLGWVRPRLRDVALGIAVPVALYAAISLLLVKGGAAAGAVQNYRAVIAAGTSPWWFVLQAWPALILAPFVEETFFRGFLWRGVQYRFGNGIAFLVTTLLFAAMHYGYWMPGGIVDVGSVVQYLISGAILGWLRWQSGGIIVPMIAHSLLNAGLKISPMVMSAVIP
jgi:membrane protease YdiL (CAAX protease family)